MCKIFKSCDRPTRLPLLASVISCVLVVVTIPSILTNCRNVSQLLDLLYHIKIIVLKKLISHGK